MDDPKPDTQPTKDTAKNLRKTVTAITSEDKPMVIFALTVLGVGAMFTLKSDCGAIVVPIVSVLGTLVSGFKNGKQQ